MHRQIVEAPRSFVELVLWPELQDLSSELSHSLAEITAKLIREEIHGETADAEEHDEPPAAVREAIARQHDRTEGQPMSSRKLHEIWIEQCDAARDIKIRYGLNAALDYVVTEKLLNFASAAADHPEFARELPRFVSEVRRMFTPEELETHVARVEREHREKDADATEEDDELFPENPATVAEQERRFAIIKELLTAPELGTS